MNRARDTLPPVLGWAIAAAQEKKAEKVTVLDLHGVASFTDYFLICSGTSNRQVQAISDAVEQRLGQGGWNPAQIEGRALAEWVLMDYRDFIVHIFTERARLFYDLERLWRASKRTEIAE
ncbi:MAG TPA: ribosome silencing factor [Candidatus Acidoferrales bacterium]